MLEILSNITCAFLAPVYKLPIHAMKAFFGNTVNVKAETPVSCKCNPRIFMKNVQP
jgi:hypothetical protein